MTALTLTRTPIDWFGVAQCPDPSHWSQQMDWHDDIENYELTYPT
jgi:hypothetical protein